MLEITRYELERRVRGTAVLSVLLSVLAVFTVAFFPSVQESNEALEQYIENLPPTFRNAFGVESFATVEGFLSTEFYQFAWVILLGIYFAYRAGSLVAGDVEDHGIDLLLATPLSRGRLVVERYLALVPVMVAVNIVAAGVVVASVAAIGEPVPYRDIAAVHALSVPYFLATAALGLVVSVLVSDESVANRLALGLVFGLFLIDSLSLSTDYDEVGAISPTRYYDPTEILVEAEYDPLGAGILCLAAVGLVGLAVLIFRRADIP
jgi:ABC-2 type transport system permease protein